MKIPVNKATARPLREDGKRDETISDLNIT